MIPKTFHFIWVGDELKRPDDCIKTWLLNHPDWNFQLWGSCELESLPWVNRDKMMAMRQHDLAAVADMMRWEILYAHGGIVVDPDSVSLRPFDEDLLDCKAFACWESEIAQPGLISANFFGCEAENAFVLKLITDLSVSAPQIEHSARQTVGSQRLTDCYRKFQYSPLRIYPSHYFIPQHFSGLTYEGHDPIYAKQFWINLGSSVSAGAPSLPSSAVAGFAGVAERSTLDGLHNPRFIQRVTVGTELAELGQLEVFASLCAGKRVLYVGCANETLGDPVGSLCVRLQGECAALDVFDIHTEVIEQLRPIVKGNLFTDLSQVTDTYDVVLVPQVMEHVPDVARFLTELEAIKASCFLISVSDASRARHFDYVGATETFVEVVHPDHNVWYTPYTFSNTIRKYSSLNVERLWFFNDTAILGLLSKPSLALAA